MDKRAPRVPSPVDAFFEATHPLDVLRALAALETISQGEVTTTATTRGRDGTPEPGGVFCPRLFGTADDAEPRWAHVDLALPILHPACVEAIGQLTELTPDEIATVLYGDGNVEYGPQDFHGLETLLEQIPGYIASVLREAGFEPTALLVHRIPVLPLADRPLTRMPGGHVMIDEVSRAYVEIVGRAAREQQLVDFGAPERILRAEAGALQRAFDRVFTRNAARTSWEPHAPRMAPWRAASAADESDPTQPIAAAFVDASSVLVQLARTTVHVDHEGKVLDAFATPDHALLGVDEEGRHAVFASSGELHVRDLRARSFVDDVPTSLLARHVSEQGGATYLVDAGSRRRVRLPQVVDGPAFAAFSPDGRHAWIEDAHGNGGVYGVETGLHEATSDALRFTPSWSLLGVDGRLGDDAPGTPGASTRAIVLSPRDRFLVTDGRVVMEDEKVILILAGPAPVVAFSRDAQQLLAVRRDHAAIVSLVGLDPAGERATSVVTRIPLTALHERRAEP